MSGPDADAGAHRLVVPRTARYYTLGPEAGAREVWFVLHGYGQLAAYFVRHFRTVDDGTRRIVAPEALSRFYLDGPHRRVGATWMTREDRLAEIDDYVAYLDALHEAVFDALDAETVTTHVLGFSQGTATACRWAAHGRARPRRLTLWAGGIPPDLDLDADGDALRRADLTMVLGTEDEYIDDDRLAVETDRLDRHAVPYRLVRFDGGHRLDADVLRALAGTA